jgi:hypothetical protein
VFLSLSLKYRGLSAFERWCTERILVLDESLPGRTEAWHAVRARTMRKNFRKAVSLVGGESRHRWLSIGLSLFAVVLSTAECRAAKPGPTILDDIEAAYVKQRQSVRTLLVEYELRSSGLAEMPVLTKYLNTGYFLNEDITLASKGDLWYYHYLGHYKETAGGEVPERTVVYDGKVLREKRPFSRKSGRELIMVQAVRKEGACYFPGVYTGAALIGLFDPGEKSPGSLKDRDRIPEMLKTAVFAVGPQSELVDGAPCIVIEAEGWQKLWLDPQKGYAVRRRILYNKGEQSFTIHCKEFERITPDVWLPRQVVWLSIGPKTAPEQYREKPLLQTDVRVRRLEANQPTHDALFELKISPGSQVFDETLTGLDPTKIPNEAGKTSPTLSYIQPANESDLGTVVDKAKAAFDRSQADARKRTWFKVFVGFLMVAITAVLAWRWLKRRRMGADSVEGNEA